MWKIIGMLSALLLICSCGGEQIAGNKPGEGEIEVTVASAAFKDGGMIPREYTADGTNVSPPLEWNSVPGGAKTLALICDDPDAPVGTWVHWVLYNLPAGRRSLPENVPSRKILDSGAVQGTNDFRKIGYGGPAPPSGTHRYYFKVYALDIKLDLEPGATKDKLIAAMKGHVLGRGELMGKYKR